MRGFRLHLLRLGAAPAVLAAAGCIAGHAHSAVPTPAGPAPPAFAVVGYLPSYRVKGVGPQVRDYLTDLIYFSVQPKPNGELDTDGLTPEILQKLREIKGSSSLRLGVAVGGWNQSAGFAPMARDPEARKRFVAALTQFCVEHGFELADMDWESPANAEEQEAYSDLLTDLKRAFGPRGLRLTAALAGWQELRPDGYAALDRLHLMAYDYPAPQRPTVALAKADVDRFSKRGVPTGKICLGLPLYGRKLEDRNEALAWSGLAARFHPTAELDEAGGYTFNGPATIREKTRYARTQGLAGVMVWEIGQDLPPTDPTSLLQAIRQTLQK